jgi:Rab GDP dissociation inhibitor
MSSGNLTKILVHTGVTKYMDFKVIDGGYVYHAYSGGTIYKVPCTPSEALTSSLVGIWQKNKFRGFLTFCGKYNPADKATHEGMDLTKVTAKALYDFYDLNEDTIDFTGHALALYMDDSYIDRPAIELVQRCQLYAHSLARYGSSPYIYPLYGLSGLPEGFSRLAAIYGGTFMLDTPVEEIVYDAAGHVCGVKAMGEVVTKGDDGKDVYTKQSMVAKCSTVIADPSYFIGTDKVRKTGQVARWIFIKEYAVFWLCMIVVG